MGYIYTSSHGAQCERRKGGRFVSTLQGFHCMKKLHQNIGLGTLKLGLGDLRVVEFWFTSRYLMNSLESKTNSNTCISQIFLIFLGSSQEPYIMGKQQTSLLQDCA